jgi:hypothetical protein
MFEVGLAGWPGAGRESAVVIPDLHEPPEPFARPVAVHLVPMITGMRWDDVELHG